VRLSAIVVAYGSEELLSGCLAALASALARVEGETEIVVVLNRDSTALERSLEGVPRAVAVRGAPGLGFAGGVAVGLAVAAGEWIALVNDDCVVAVDAAAELLAAGEARDDVGSVAAQVVFAARPDTLNSAGIEVDDLGVARERLLGREPIPASAEPEAVFGASAALGLFRRAMLDAVGGLDASFFAYLEDADLAWRAQMAGWRCLLAPGALGVHHHSPTLGHGSPDKYFLVGRNRVRTLAKNASGRQLRRGLVRIVAYDLLYVAYVAATRRTLAPLAGRVRGVREWRAYRALGSPGRRELSLARAPGLGAALRRSRVYDSLAPVAPGLARAVARRVAPGGET
jgi:GT2 family glycosyltransferase